MKSETKEKILKTYPSFLDWVESYKSDKKPWYKTIFEDFIENFKVKKNYPNFKSWLFERWVPYKWRMSYYKISYRTFDRYNVIKIKSLKPNYYDFPERILHANFQLLTDFVKIDRERIDNLIGSDPSSLEAVALKEILDLSKWWTEIRPKREEVSTYEKSKILGIKIPPDTMYKVEKDGKIIYQSEEWKKEDYPEYVKLIKDSMEQEKSWQREDEENLIRLMKVRLHISA